jgi:hypothetical protein
MGRVIWTFAAMVGVVLGLVLPAPALHAHGKGLFVAVNTTGR